MRRPSLPLALALALALTAGPARAATLPTASLKPTELGTLSAVASSTDASAVVVNPAALGFLRGSELFVSRSVNGLNQTHLFLTGGPVGFGFQQYTLGSRFANGYSLAASTRPFWGFTLGARGGFYQFLDGQGGNTGTLDLALAYRPTEWLSLAAALDNVSAATWSGTTAGSRIYRLGLGLRPFGDRLTLTGDLPLVEGAPLTLAQPYFGVAVEPLNGLTLRGVVDPSLSMSFGIGLALGGFGTHAMSGAARPRHGESDLVAFTLSELAPPRSLDLRVPQAAYLRATGDLRDHGSGAFFSTGPRSPGVREWTRKVAQAASDPGVKALVLDCDGVSAGLADLSELRQALVDFKAAGKPLVVYLRDAGIGAYYLATAADQIVMHPGGSLDIKGLATTNMYLKGTLDKLGITPQFVAIGKYKAAPEQFTRTGPSQSAQEQEKALLDALFAELTTTISASRKLAAGDFKALVDRALFTPEQAKERGLIDAIAQPDQVPGVAKIGDAAPYQLVERKPATWAEPDEIAIVSVDGEIVGGDSGDDLLRGGVAGAETLAATLRGLKERGPVKAVVLRVDSPGGDALASDVIGREVKRLKDAGKPVIVSMGNVAASGGYWIAAAGGPIYASPATITGSIGVFAGRFAIGGLLTKLGITTHAQTLGARARMDDPTHALTPAESELFREQARYTYGRFLKQVSAGRGLTETQVDAVAQGRVWSGADAKARKLVDRFGGLEAALAAAYAETKLDPAKSVVGLYPSLDSLATLLEGGPMAASVRRTLAGSADWTQWKLRLMAPGAGTVTTP